MTPSSADPDAEYSLAEARTLRQQRRASLRFSYGNALLWGWGNGLASTSLAIYLALELDAPQLGLGIGLLLAGPQFIGTLRLFSPYFINRIEQRKPFCIRLYLLSAWWFLGISLLVFLTDSFSSRLLLLLLVALWCSAHLYEYFATIALWSWLDDTIPFRLRGRFIGRRNRWLLSGTIAATLASSLFLFVCETYNLFEDQRLVEYSVLNLLGCSSLIIAVIPLAFIRQVPATQSVSPWSIRPLLAPLQSSALRGFLLYACWFSFANGITQSAQGIYPKAILAISLSYLLLLRSGMRIGQWLVSPQVGRWADRWGNRKILIASQMLVAFGPLFYFLASKDSPHWIIGAWLVWIAYAGLNISLPAYLLKIVPSQWNQSGLSLYFAFGGIFYAIGTLLGGTIVDLFAPFDATLDTKIAFYGQFFIIGCCLRMLGVPLLLCLTEK
ncbi:Hypothetical protein PBC10988_8520 [Planctomycetales bacterium 10988]|nr:Hypothetical protein PBC10988_8520 [Planctomycetales bacterium 10988]